MMSHPPSRVVRLVFALCALAAAAPSAHAQLSSLDKVQLIEGLRKEGMGDLLKHLIATDPPTDPILARQVKINQLLLDYAEKGARIADAPDDQTAQRLAVERMKAFNDALDERRNLIKEFRDHEQRPTWQTDLAEQLLFEYLPEIKLRAMDFYEVGVPSAEQRQAYETAIPEALTQLSDADIRLFFLKGDLPRKPDFTKKYVDTGVFNRLMNEYGTLRTPYYLAHAAYYAALLPDSHPYYKNLGDPEVTRLIVQQKKTIAEERARLLDLAVMSLEKFVKDKSDQWSVRPVSVSLSGRAMVMVGKPQDANKPGNALDAGIALLDEASKANEPTVLDLVTKLAKAGALDRKGDTQGALDLLATLASHSMTKQDLLFRLLVVDQTHRVLLRRVQSLPAEKRAAALADAYEPYQKLLTDPSLKDNLQSFRAYIYRRWEENIPAGTDMGQVPSPVVAAIAQTQREKGQALLEQGTDESRKQARALIDKAISLNTDLLKRNDLNATTRAQSLFNLGVAIYYQERQPGNDLRAAGVFTDLAEQFPDQPMSEGAMTDAVSLTRGLFEKARDLEGVPAAYERAVNVLFEKYGASRTAENERIFFATEVLEPAGNHQRAAEVLAKVPVSHPAYFGAQLKLIFDLQQVYRQLAKPVDPKAKPATAPRTQGATPTRDEAAKTVIAEATRLLNESANPPGNNANVAALAKQANGWSRIILAEMAGDFENDANKALGILRDFEGKFGGDAELIRVMLEKRILLLLKANQLDEAVKEGSRMMTAFPDDAAPVVDKVISEVDKQNEQLNAAIGRELVERNLQALKAQKAKLSEMALKLSTMLQDWAIAKKLPGKQLLGVKLTYAKALRLNGKYDESIAVSEPLLKEFPKQADAIFGVAEAYFGKGSNPVNEAILREKALPAYIQITNGLRPENGKYPATWWNAQLRRLQVDDLTGKDVKNIPVQVRALQARDPNLGGDAFKTEFKRLEQKHSAL